jgi:endoglucanase
MRVYHWLLITLSLLLSACASIQPTASGPRDSAGMQHRYKTASLRVDGSRLVTAGGREVELRGVNLGGWLVTEGWMCGFTDSRDTKETNGDKGSVGRSALESLEARFGPEKAATLMGVWQDHWITARDLDHIRERGFNLVRVPISYRTLQHADGSWALNARGEIDFSRMDWIVREAAQRGIYTIFDLHVWPGQRQSYEDIGRPEGEPVRQAMAQLWTAVAVHYRGNGAVAAFDLINEFPGAWGIQQELSRAVRKADPDRVQVIEGFTYAEFIKLHKAGEFPNSVFSDHLYGAGPLTTEEIKARLKVSEGSPVPVYIGEVLAADFKTAAEAMSLSKAAWSSWTYKTVDMGDWGIFNYYSTVKTDIQNDSYDSILAKWSTDLTQWQRPGSPTNSSIKQDRRLTVVTGANNPL